MKTTIVSALLAVTGVAAAQAFSPDTEKSRIESSQLEAKFGPVPTLPAGTQFGGVMKALSNEYWQLLRSGYLKGGEKYGVKIDAQAPSNESDQIGQLSMMNTMLGKDYKALLISPQSDVNLLPGIQKAGKTSLVLNVNDAVAPSAQHFVGNSQYDNGVSVANYLLKTFPKGGQVAVIEGQAGVYAARQRTLGFKTTLAKNPALKVVASVPADWDRQKAFTTARDLLRRYPNLTAFYCNNDTMALGVVEAVKASGRLGKTLVFGTDGINAAYDSIKKGELTGTVDSFPILTGEVAVEVAVRLLGGQKLPRVVATPQALVMKDNMAQYEQFKK
ncbi:ribose transport system substrate-binding protein [Deinococcus metalli]|uniref:LacI family transcriptional regulator n=1 Tax=Deinococcus metalli TaxID=1141878 RepID=A0A7W8KCW9_9DEIO|nr:substrate-binding domain-containing protein [Deinococcus metalli]MBB5375791.1 ribose transport system substrate-binding protein [Deinococcus metalli]GHF37019.1 LacI family transcriptional regulator [Deinococcus metalli]